MWAWHPRHSTMSPLKAPGERGEITTQCSGQGAPDSDLAQVGEVRRSGTPRFSMFDGQSKCPRAGQTDWRISDPRAEQGWVFHTENPRAHEYYLSPRSQGLSAPSRPPKRSGCVLLRQVHSFAGASVAEDHRPGAELQTFPSHSSGGWRPKISVPAWWGAEDPLRDSQKPSCCVRRALA